MRRVAEIKHLPMPLRRRFTRALQLLGAGSTSQWIHVQVRRAIREAEARFGNDLFSHLTEEERWIAEIIHSGAAELAHIAQESAMPVDRVARVIARLVQIGQVEERRKGGKTAAARGAAIKLYFLAKPLPALLTRDDDDDLI